MQDRLSEIFEMQKSFTEKFLDIKKNLKLNQIDKQSLQHLTKQYILSIIVQATQMLTTQQWKMHIKQQKINSNDNFLEQAIDVLKYLIGILIIHGFTADDIYEKFVSKSNVVDAKFRQNLMLDSIKNDDKKIVFIDIDCVLADWVSGYTQFINRQLNTHYKSYKQFQEQFKFTKNRYEMKQKFRLSGEKRFLKMLPGASQLTMILNSMGFYVILITARPYNKYFRIYSDTLQWLVSNNIYYDGIIWNRQKEKYIIENFNKDKIQFVIDDQSDNIEKYLHAGFNCIQIKNTDNNFKQNIFKTDIFQQNNKIIYANSCQQIIDRFIIGV